MKKLFIITLFLLQCCGGRIAFAQTKVDTCRVILTVPDSALVCLATPDSISNSCRPQGKSMIHFATYKEYWQVNYYNAQTVHSYQKYFDNNWKEVKIPIYFNWKLKQ